MKIEEIHVAEVRKARRRPITYIIDDHRPSTASPHRWTTGGPLADGHKQYNINNIITALCSAMTAPRHAALLTNSTSSRLITILVQPIGDDAVLFFHNEEEEESFTSIQRNVSDTIQSNDSIDSRSAEVQNGDVMTGSIETTLENNGCKRYVILSNKSNNPLDNNDDDLSNDRGECVNFISRMILGMYSKLSGVDIMQLNNYHIPTQDIQQLHDILSQLLEINYSNNFFFSRSKRRYHCPCHADSCEVDKILSIVCSQFDTMSTYNEIYNNVLSRNRRKDDARSKTKHKRLRVYLGMDREWLTSSASDTSKSLHATSQLFVSNHTVGNITVLPRTLHPLISITISPIIKDVDPNLNVMTNPLLRSCVKRLFVGRKVLHFEADDSTSCHSPVQTILSVNVPSKQHDSEERVLLSYRVMNIQSKVPSVGFGCQYLILPGTRIVFQPPEESANADIHPSVQLDKSALCQQRTITKIREKHANNKGIPPHQHLLEALQSILMLNTKTNASSSVTPVLRSFLFSGPPGVGKTFAVKQAMEIANSWYNASSALSPQDQRTYQHIKLISIRGSELLASAEGGQYASAARDLEKQFRTAVDICERTMEGNATDRRSEETDAVILFLDECDALVSSSIVVAAMLAMLLDLMESGETLGWRKLLVVAATNRVDDIPSFLRRPGRLEKEVVVSPPSSDERFALMKDMLASHFQNHSSDDGISGLRLNISDCDLRDLADTCVGYVAADLAALVRRAIILGIERLYHTNTTRNDQMSIVIQDLVNATNDVGASCLRDSSLSAPPKTTWDDIAGDAGGAKIALRQAIEWPRTRKAAFKALGLSPPRGVLLHGPPGCAKTTLARAAAGSAGVAFLSLSPADVYSSSFVGDAEGVVRRAFDLARSAAPCVLFFDEIDSIIGGDDEGSGHGMGRGSSAEARVLSTFLNEMDGVDGSVEDGVLVLGATNRPSTLDAALLRPGRFDKVIYVPPPDECGRKDILKMECVKWQDSIFGSNSDVSRVVDCHFLEKSFGLGYLAADEITGLMTGAELVGACRETAVIVMRKLLIAESPPTDERMSEDFKCLLMQALKVELEVKLKTTEPLLSDASVLEEYTRFEEEHKS